MKLAALFLVVLGCILPGFAADQKKTEPLELRIAADADGAVTNGLGYLNVTFRNVSEKRVRILRMFSGNAPLDIWFGIVAYNTNGVPFGVGWGGKVQLRHELEYVALDAQERFSFRLDAGQWGPKVEPGKYKVKIMYMNQYGKECFEGFLESNVIELVVK